MNKSIISLLACIALGCEKKSEIDAMYEAMDYETPTESYSAGFGSTDDPGYTATKSRFDGNFYCVVIKQPIQGNGRGPSSLRRKNGIVLTDIGSATYSLPKPGVFTLSTVPDETTLVEVTDFTAYPSHVQDFINQKAEGAPLAIAIEEHTVVTQLSRIVIPKVNISDATIEEAFDYIRNLSMVHDNEPDATRKGVSMIIRGSTHMGDDVKNLDAGQDEIHGENSIKITYSAENVAYFDLVAEVARQAKMDAYLTSVGFTIIPEGSSPFPNTKASEGEIWKVIRQTQKP